MENLKSIDTILKEINSICLTIQRKSLSVLKIVKYEGIDIVKDIQKDKPHIDLQTLLTMLQNEAIQLSSESEKISEEVKIFNISLANGADISKSGCEILRDVWFGDAYDSLTGYDALVALKRDLKIQSKETNIEAVIQRVLDTGTIKNMTEKKKKKSKNSKYLKKRIREELEANSNETEEKILEDFPSITPNIPSPKREDNEKIDSEDNSNDDRSKNGEAGNVKISQVNKVKHPSKYNGSDDEEYYDTDEYNEDND